MVGFVINMELLEKMVQAYGVSGNEGAVRSIIQEELKGKLDELYVDKLGNLIGRKKGKKPRLMLAAHMDEIGLMVKQIDNTGRIYCSEIGGLDPLNLLGEQIHIQTKSGKIHGMITSKEISNDYPIEKLPSIRDIFIDTGLSKKELEKRGVEAGDYVAFDRVPFWSSDNNIITGKALDDRIGCYVLIELAKSLKTEHEVYFVFTVQEEVGLYGAKTSAFEVSPDMAVAVDVTNANDCNEEPTKELGKGPTLTMKDEDMIANKCLNDYFKKNAKKMNIPLQLEVSNFGTTDALNISLSKEGVPSTVLGVCVRNLHTMSSMANKHDINHAIELLKEFLKHPPETCMGP